MKEWLLSVSAVVILMVLLELVISEGKIKKYIQGIVRLALVVTMFVPIIKIVGKDVNFDFVVDDNPSDAIINYDFLDRVYELRYKNAEKDIEKDLEGEGILGASVHISIYYGTSCTVEVDNVVVDLSATVISGESGNILLNEKVKKTVTARLKISEEKIIIYGSA